MKSVTGIIQALASAKKLHCRTIAFEKRLLITASALIYVQEILLLPCKPYFCHNFFLVDWRYKHLKNIRSLVILQRTLLWIFGKWFMKILKKPFHFTTCPFISHLSFHFTKSMGHRHFEILWSFILYKL